MFNENGILLKASDILYKFRDRFRKRSTDWGIRLINNKNVIFFVLDGIQIYIVGHGKSAQRIFFKDINN